MGFQRHRGVMGFQRSRRVMGFERSRDLHGRSAPPGQPTRAWTMTLEYHWPPLRITAMSYRSHSAPCAPFRHGRSERAPDSG